MSQCSCCRELEQGWTHSCEEENTTGSEWVEETPTQSPTSGIASATGEMDPAWKAQYAETVDTDLVDVEAAEAVEAAEESPPEAKRARRAADGAAAGGCEYEDYTSLETASQEVAAKRLGDLAEEAATRLTVLASSSGVLPEYEVAFRMAIAAVMSDGGMQRRSFAFLPAQHQKLYSQLCEVYVGAEMLVRLWAEEGMEEKMRSGATPGQQLVMAMASDEVVACLVLQRPKGHGEFWRSCGWVQGVRAMARDPRLPAEQRSALAKLEQRCLRTCNSALEKIGTLRGSSPGVGLWAMFQEGLLVVKERGRVCQNREEFIGYYLSPEVEMFSRAYASLK